MKDLSKMLYLQNRCYLDMGSALRQDSESFPDKEIETRPKPCSRDYQVLKSFHVAYDSAKKKCKCKSIVCYRYVRACCIPKE